MEDVMSSAYKLHMGPAKCALDLGDGSERAEYVNQDYIFSKLGRPHRSINIMYCYYPFDKGWPQRAGAAFSNSQITFQWDYPYDDYFTYGGGQEGNTDGEPFVSMRDIRRHGQDITLTLTIDCSVTNTQLKKIAQDLKPFGRMRLRINHECAGNWFTHNKRYTYQEVGDFFVRFHDIIKVEAPNIQTIFCAGFLKDTGELEYEKEFLNAYKRADIWSGDCYIALHYGWPFDICEKISKSYMTYTFEQFYNRVKNARERIVSINDGKEKSYVMSEFNADGDVTGPLKQGEALMKFANALKNEKKPWLSGFSLYQFRDRGRLGLEIEDPNNQMVGIEQPLMEVYKEILADPFFMPELRILEKVNLPIRLRWGGSEDADGVAFNVMFLASPVFCEVTFEEALNLIFEINGKWFYKKSGLNTIDVMSAFFNKPIHKPTELTLKVFAPPDTGENESNQGDDWIYNYYVELRELPKLRIRYESIKDIEL